MPWSFSNNIKLNHSRSFGESQLSRAVTARGPAGLTWQAAVPYKSQNFATHLQTEVIWMN